MKRILKVAATLVAAVPILGFGPGAQAQAVLTAYWDFNDTSSPAATLDKVYGFEGALEGGAVFAAGRTGGAGDNAIDFGLTTAGQIVRVSNAACLNYGAAGDQVTISFWQSLHAIAASSAFWGVSPSSNNGERGIQAHTPWNNNNIYFDTAGCCDAATQRINADVVAAVPDFATGWHHLAFVKSGSSKQIWVDGTLFLEGTNTSPLPTDFVRLIIGGDGGGGNSIQGVIDDFAVFAGALDAAAIGQLASGTAPDALSGIPALTEPLVGGAIGSPTGFSLGITESAALPVDEGSIQAQFDGSVVAVDASKSGSLTTIVYTHPGGLLAPGSTHEVIVDFQDSGATAYQATRQFTVPNYIVVPPSFALPPGSGDAGQRGFVWNMAQNEALQANTVQRALDQLGGNLIDAGTGEPYENYAAYYTPGVAINTPGAPDPLWEPISFEIDSVINVNQDPANERNGNFQPDDQMPGIPGTTGSTDGIAAEVLTYAEIPAPGVYTLIVNSDDGFRTIIAPRNPRDATGLTVGVFNAGRGAADTAMVVYFSEAGVYPMQTIWFEGGGGANLELLSQLDTGVKVLLNDTANGGLATYRAATGAGLYVSSATPASGATGVRPDTAYEVQLMDAGGKTVDPGSIMLSLDGEALTTTVTKSGAVTTVTADSTGLLAAGSTHELVVEFGASGDPTLTGTWSFAVADYPSVPPTLGSMPGTGEASEPGMNVLVHQRTMPGDFTDTGGGTTPTNQGLLLEEQVEVGEGQLAGLFGPNAAWQPESTTDVVNYDQDATGTSTIGNFGPDAIFPGLSEFDNFACEFTTYVEFPEAGYYQMGVNSDDGFRGTVAEAAPRQYLQVEAPASIAGPIGAVPTSRGIDGAAFGGPIPTTPIVAEAVLVEPNDACSALTNPEALVGKIALIDRGVCGFVDKCRLVQQAGAVAAVIIDERPQFPFTMGGDAADVTIPCLMILQSDGAALKANLDGLVMSIGSDSGFLLGQFTGGRGSSDTIYGFAVPVPGVYPLRVSYYEGGGGANVEWFSVTADGEKILLNDTTNPNALKAYRSWNYDPLPIPVEGRNLAFVSFHAADDAPDADAAGAGFTEAPDVGYTRLLADNGHTVTRIVTSGTPDVAALNQYDLVILSRSVPSGDYQDPPETALWNGITQPVLILNGYLLRNSRLGFTTGGTMVDSTGPITLTAATPAHPLFAGIALDAQNVTSETFADVVTFNATVQRGVSVNTDALVDGATLLASVATAADPTVGGMIAAEYAAGTVVGAGRDVLAGHRMVLLTGSREQGITAHGAGIYDLSPMGAQMLLNAVDYMAETPPPRLNIGLEAGNVVIGWEGEGTLQSADAVAGPYTDVAGASSPYSTAPAGAAKFYRARQ